MRTLEKSPGPKTIGGKARCARNAFKGGTRPMLRELADALRHQCRRIAGLRRNG